VVARATRCVSEELPTEDERWVNLDFKTNKKVSFSFEHKIAVFTMTVRIADYQAMSSNHDNAAGDDAVSLSDPIVVVKFRTPAKYHLFTVCFLALAPASAIVSLALVYFDETVSYGDRGSIINGLLWAIAVVLIIYSLLLPKRFEVLSDASIRVVMWTSLAHTFPNATAAYENPPMHQNLFRFRLYKFNTDLDSRVVVTRRKGWDLLVSLHDAPGFVAAVWEVASEVETRIGII
jgi:hypothetical protein